MKQIKIVVASAMFCILQQPSALAAVSLKGSGSVLAAPLCQHWIRDYTALHPQVKIKYEAKNSSDGISQWIGRGADFALSDTGLTSAEERRIIGRPSFHLPVAIEAVAITYNLPGVADGLRLSPWVLSSIFMGNIKRWNDSKIAALNPEKKLPALDILVLHRSEESALHDLFPSFLARTNSKWTAKRGKEKKLHWPVGSNIHQNEKIHEKLRKQPGYIAAVDYSYAALKGLPMAAIRNEAGFFVAPSPETLLAATSDILQLPDNFRVFLESSRAPQAYPLCSFLWMLVYQDAYKACRNHDRAGALVDFLKWVLTKGQKTAEELSYLPLPEKYLSRVRAAVESMKY